MDRIKVLLIEKPSKDRELITETLSKIDYIELVGVAENQEEAAYYIYDNFPHVILIGMNLDVERHDLAKSISTEFNHTAIIMIENELKEDTMYTAIFAGAKDVIVSPFTSAKLVDAVYRTAQLTQEQSPLNRETSTSMRRRSSAGHVVTVFSTKGGVGKTFIATNLAVALARNTEKKVCIVDLDLDFGNTALALNMVPKYTIHDVVANLENINSDVMELYLTPHESGVKVLPANAKPQLTESIQSEQIEVILKALKGIFDYIIIDMPGRFYEPANPAFQASDLLLMVTTPEIATIRNIKSSVHTLYDLNFPKSKIKIVLNMAESFGQIKSKDVENTLNQSLYSVIPSDYKHALLSLNDGTPVSLLKPKRALERSLDKLSRKIETEFAEVKQK